MGVSNLAVVSSNMETHEELRMPISHVQAQTTLICGKGLQNLCDHSGQIKNRHVTAISEKAERALALIDRCCGAS